MVYRNALAEADGFFDYHLKETALFLRDQPVEYQFPTPIPPSDIAYDFVVQIWTIDGRRIYIGPEQAVLPNSTALGYSTVNTSVGQWRVYGTVSPTKVVQVAQPMSVRRREAAQLALRTLAPFALLVPLLGLLVWFAVGHALQPLQRLAKAVKARRVTELEPLSDERLPEEVQPLVGSLNDLLGRLTAALERERAFMADAAHELRTPLTALHLQLGALTRAATEGERTAAMGKLSEGVQRAIRLVEQMLAFARQEPRAEPVRTRFALDELAREVVAELVPLADARRIDLGMSEAQAVLVQGEREAVATLVRNLVDNAVRYTPPGGRVDVSVERSPTVPPQAIVKVVDNGPGIAPEEREPRLRPLLPQGRDGCAGKRTRNGDRQGDRGSARGGGGVGFGGVGAGPRGHGILPGGELALTSPTSRETGRRYRDRPPGRPELVKALPASLALRYQA